MWQTFAWRWPDGRFQTASVFDDIEEDTLHTSGAVAVVQCSRPACYTSLLFNLASFQWLTNGFNGLPTYPSELAHTHAQDSCAQRLQATAIFFIVISKIIVLYFFVQCTDFLSVYQTRGWVRVEMLQAGRFRLSPSSYSCRFLLLLMLFCINLEHCFTTKWFQLAPSEALKRL